VMIVYRFHFGFVFFLFVPFRRSHEPFFVMFSSWEMNVFPHLICSFLEVVETVKVLCDNVLGC
ncbi:MAG: hypothetical protein IKQ72_10740, partial [Bacteroidaceae bacterium]|nr:hypothetical protein [Bacteroidaceae bacterium]